MSHKHHRSKGKTVQKMTRDGLVQENLATGEVKHISSRTVEQEFRHNSSGDTQNTAMQAPSASRHSVYQQDFSVRNAAEPTHSSQAASSGSAAPVEQHSHSRYSQASLRQTNAPVDTATPSAAIVSNNPVADTSSTPDFRQTDSQQESHPRETDSSVLQTGHHQLQTDSALQRTATPPEQPKHHRHQPQPDFRQEETFHPAVPEQPSYQPVQDILYNKVTPAAEPTAPVAFQPPADQPLHQRFSDPLYYNVGTGSDTNESSSFRQSAEQQRLDFRQSDSVSQDGVGSTPSVPEPNAVFHSDPVRQEFQTSHREQPPAEHSPAHRQHSQYAKQPDNFSAAVTPEDKPYEPYPANQEQKKSEPSAYTSDTVSVESPTFQTSVPESFQVSEHIPYHHQGSVLGSYVVAAAEQHARQARNYHETARHGSYQEQHSREEFQTSHEQFHDDRRTSSHNGGNDSNASPSAQPERRKHAQRSDVHRTAQSAAPDTRTVDGTSSAATPDTAYSSTKIPTRDNGIDLDTRTDSKPVAKGSASQQIFSTRAASQPEEKAEVPTIANGVAHEKAPTLQSRHERLQQSSADFFRADAKANQSETAKTSSKKRINQEHRPSQFESETVISAVPSPETTRSQAKDNHVNLLHRQDKDNISASKDDLNLRPAEKPGSKIEAKFTPALQEAHGQLQQSTAGLTGDVNAKSTPAEPKKSVFSQKRPQTQQGKSKGQAPDVPKSDTAVSAAIVTPIVTAEQPQTIKAAKVVTAESKSVAAGKQATKSVKDNGIPIKHRVEKPEAAASDTELDFSKRTAEKNPGKKKAAQEAALKNRRQKIFQEQSEAGKPEASAAPSAKGSKPTDKPDAGKKLLTRKEQLKQKAAVDSARKTADSGKTVGDAKQAPTSSDKKAQGKKIAEAKSTQSGKKKSAEQSKQAARKKSRLQFSQEDECGKSSISGKMKSGVKAAAGLAVGAAGTVIHGKLHEAEQENTAVEALHKTELLTERGIRTTKNLHNASRLHQEKVAAKKASRLREAAAESQSVFHLGELEKKQVETKKKGLLNRFFQKQQNKRRAAEAARAAKSGTKKTAQTAKSTASAVERTATAIKDFAVSHKKAGIALVALLLLFTFLLTQLQSCSVIASQSLGSISASSWPADDSEITQADLYYSKLEAELQYKIDHMESSHSGCDEYNYNIGEIGHDPVVLISYLCAKYGDFTFNNEIKRELESLFAQQYQLTEEVKNETRTVTKSVRVGESLGNVVTSGYCNCSICCGQWAGGPTASGAYPQANHTIAVDASNPFVPMGTKVVMNGVEYTVEDTGALDQYGVQFDVYYDSHSAASAHGHQTWAAYIADDNGSQTVEVTTTENVKACYVTLTSANLTTLVNSLLDSDQKERYDIYTSSRGNRCFLGSPFETNWRGNISSYFGYRTSPTTGEVTMHEGLDIAMPEGTQILSVQDGTVQTAGYSSSYGNYIVIKNDDGYQTLYAHCKTLNVSAGQTVEEGDVIATVGSTGNSTGNHLHIEFRYKGDLYNPYLYLNTGSGSACGGGGGAALTTEKQQKLFAEAEKYLGMPYVWGGSSPSTGFDCSGFVSYVFTASGVYNMGRLTAQGIYDICTPISASEAQPGDIIFFVGTYDTPGVSHVGIYAGNGQMLHCGDPIQYTSIETSYWQSHFYAFGRVGN